LGASEAQKHLRSPSGVRAST
ncbi:hypothetical protein DBR06_SOUSAS9710105, partial [Sousa chinensis]